MYISLDIGGTKLMVAAFSETHKLLARERADTPVAVSDGLTLLKTLTHKVASGEKIKAIGVSAGGPLNYKTGVISPLHMPKWRDVPLKDIFEDAFGAPCAVDVDTNAAALAEYTFGGHQSDRLFYLTLSTGVGGGFIVDGSIYRGANDSHPEAGHQSISHRLLASGSMAKSIPCACGATDCLEAIVSGTAIRKHYQKPAEQLTPSEWDEVAYNLGQGLRNLSALYAPSIIALGGGVAVGGGTRLIDGARAVLERNLKIVPVPEITISSLGYDTALWGGLAMAVRAS
jgi:predicted NBD/HSP70 family sugar kinase